MLQSLLQPRDNQRSKMIGAMPAVAVRHERRRAEKRIVVAGPGRRPSQLPLQLGRPQDADPTPSPDHNLRSELYICGKVAALHAIVGSLLLGIVVLVVGLVQLSPGAEAAQHRYYLIYSGAALVTCGILCAVLRCICLHFYNRKFREEVEEEEHEHTGHKNGVSVVESGHGHGHNGHKSSHDKSGHHDKSHDKSGHHEKSHNDKTPDKAGHHDKSTHDKSSHGTANHEKGHHDKGHQEKDHDKGHDKVAHDKKTEHDKDINHETSTNEHKSDKSDDKKLKAQASVAQDSNLTKQHSGTSDT